MNHVPRPARLIALTLAAILFLAPLSARAAQAATSDLIGLIPTLTPTAVNINFLKYERQAAKPGQATPATLVPADKGVGSGFIVEDSRGLIVTNRHVTDGGDEIHTATSTTTPACAPP